MGNREIGRIWFISGYGLLDPDKPTLIFIHGAALSGIFWEPQITFLKDDANMVAVSDLLRSILLYFVFVIIYKPKHYHGIDTE
jgi:pimeloyl-ACP methyl ester carboxylesterase